MPKPVMSQEDFLQILFDGLGYNRLQRNAWCTGYVGRPIKYLDELSRKEKHDMITLLRLKREEAKEEAELRDLAREGRDDE